MTNDRKIKHYEQCDWSKNNCTDLPPTLSVQDYNNGKPFSPIHYTPVFEEQYKQGEWLYGEDAGCSWVFRYLYSQGPKTWYDFVAFSDSETRGKDWCNSSCVKGPATEEQLLSHLSAAAVKKGYNKGTKVKDNILGYPRIDEFYIAPYHLGAVSIRGDGGCFKIFDLNTLQWAEIIEQPKEVEQQKISAVVNPKDYTNLPLPQKFENSEMAISITSITLSNGKVITAEELSRI